MIEIRKVRVEDVGRLEADLPFGLPGKHRDRLARQERGEVLYLAAWDRGRAVGHVLLVWAGAEEQEVRAALPGCPDQEDLLVHPGERGRGVGGALIAEAERRANRAGHSRIGLSVGVSNLRARSLYERLGYFDSGIGEFVERGPTWEERCVYLVRRLG